MPISIAQSQARNMDYLDSQGIDQSELQPVNLSATARALATSAGKFVKNAQRNLIKADRVSTGGLSKSIKAGNIEVKNETLEIKIYAEKYYEYLDKGVNGTQFGRGSEYSYKQKGPPIKDIEKWLKKEKGKHTVKAKPKLNREKARANIQDDTRGLAIYISKQIKKNGLKPTRFWTKALDILRKDLPESIKLAVITDIKNSF